NFLHGFPVYAVSIALSVKGKIEQAVVYDPSRNDLFTATRGRGAFMNEKRIRVSKRTQLKDSLVSTGFPFRPGDNFKSYLMMMADVMPRTAGLRRPGAAALDLAYVAAGFCDGFFETGLSIWDVAAGSLLVTEAGGLVGNFTGEADYLEQRECLAATPRVYGQLVSILGKYSKFAGAGDKAAIRQASMPWTSGEETSDAAVASTEHAAVNDEASATSTQTAQDTPAASDDPAAPAAAPKAQDEAPF
ncbi:inositol monophosphatase family protein, partial [Aquabacterium sp.]|uniref:inositol monophosphatase family protein n=1 Tax=Aquabacterium sp. TaxID=1872578 RepID=UPI003B6E7BF6